MQSSWPRAIIFDLDGTLVDSAPDIAEAINAGFGPLGVPPFPIEDVKTMIGGGAQVAISRAAKLAKLALDPETEAGVLARFMEVYARASAEGRGLYPSVHDVLSGLRNKGVGLALCTNKAEHITHITLEALGIAGYFTAVVAARNDLPKKPHPAMLLKALEPFRIAARDAVMVGDSHADVEGGRAAGCRVIAVSYGYSSTPAADLGADCVIDDLTELPTALVRLKGAAVSR